jgi:hypothetical protein
MTTTKTEVAELTTLLEEERAKNAELHELLDKSLAVWTSGDLYKVKVKYENIKAETFIKDLMKDVSGIDRAFISVPMLDRDIKRKSSNLPVIVIGDFNHHDLLKITVKAILDLNREVVMLKYSAGEWAEMLAEKRSFAVKAEAGDKIMLKGF